MDGWTIGIFDVEIAIFVFNDWIEASAIVFTYFWVLTFVLWNYSYIWADIVLFMTDLEERLVKISSQKIDKS